MDRRSARVGGVCVLLLLAAYVAASSPLLSGGSADVVSASSRAPPADGVTVITTQDAGRETLETAEIVAFRPNGSVLYYDDSYGTYFDVDPVPGTRYTVTYVASEFVSAADCPASDPCVRNLIVRTNLSTGESTVLYERLRIDRGDSRWHDADRINDTHYVVADLSAVNRVYVVNVSSGIVTWSWSAQSAFDVRSGEGYGNGWTHVNDVEVTPDGPIMVSARNQDRVVFIDRATGVDRGWTLGAEDAHDVLYEQHNPDYIPPADGGPAVIVADSENDRVVEYQRRDGSWERTWSYRDARLQWPRDADRLPNGHTLITDSNGDRVFEVDETGEVVWSFDVALPYEAERLSTPDESGGGPSAATADLPSVPAGGAEPGVSDDPDRGLAQVLLESLVPAPILGAILFVAPAWVGFPQLLALLLLLGLSLAWLGAEVYHSGYRLDLRAVVTRRE